MNDVQDWKSRAELAERENAQLRMELNKAHAELDHLQWKLDTAGTNPTWKPRRYSSILPRDKIAELRDEYNKLSVGFGDMTKAKRDLAERFGVSLTTMFRVINRRGAYKSR